MIMWSLYSLLQKSYCQKKKRKMVEGESLFNPCNHVEQQKRSGIIHASYTSYIWDYIYIYIYIESR